MDAAIVLGIGKTPKLSTAARIGVPIDASYCVSVGFNEEVVGVYVAISLHVNDVHTNKKSKFSRKR